jgi:hypothetical protein
VDFDSRLVESRPVDRAGTLALARGARRFLVKLGAETIRLDAGGGPLVEGDAIRYLLHEDGFLRVPVLVVDDLLVRGFTEDLYREALGARAAS